MINIKETISVNNRDATITYELLDEFKAATIYKKIRVLTDVLNTCKDYNTFYSFIKSLKPNKAYNITEILLWKESGFFVRIGNTSEDESGPAVDTKEFDLVE